MGVNELVKRDVENVPNKQHVIYDEDKSSLNRSGLTVEDQEFLDNYPADRKKKLIRKVDVSFPTSSSSVDIEINSRPCI